MPAWETWGFELWWWLAGLALSAGTASVGALGLLAPISFRRGRLACLTADWRGSAVCGSLLVGGLVGAGWQTWRGSEVTPLAAPFDLNEADAQLHQRHFPDGAIQTAPPDPSYACHDWTFVGGRYSLSDAEVRELLDSSAWEPVRVPQPGDVIAYFGIGGGIKHTGLVRSLDGPGRVVVESKWGPLGRYLHPADVQDFAANYVFYRPTNATMAE